MRRLLLLALAISGLVFGSAARAETLRFRLKADPVTLDWNLAHTSLETYVIMNLMEGLAEEDANGKVVPALAERWDVSSDGKSYVFHLRPGVKWSDGVALKAKDFEESWLRLLDPALNSGYSSFLDDIEGAEAYRSGRAKDRARVRVKALDDHRLEVKLRRRVPFFLHLTTFWVTFPVRGDLIRKHAGAWTLPGKLVTLGPYMLSEWTKGEVLRLRRNPNYYQAARLPTGTADEVEAVIEPDDQKGRAAFTSGKLDFLLNATTQDLLNARAKPAGGARVAQFPYLATYYLGFNTNAGPLKNPEIRRAVASSLNIEGLPSALQGGETAGRSWIPPGIEGFDPVPRNRPTQVEARQTLAKAGFIEGQGFPKLLLWIEPFDGAEAAGRHLASALRTGLGIETEVKYAPLVEMKRARFPASLFVGHWGADFADPDTMLGVYFQGSGTNYTGWASKEYDRLIERARASGDGAARLAAYQEAEALLLDRETVIVPLFYKKNTVLLGPRVKEFAISPLNYLFLKSVTLQAAKPK